MWVVLLILIGAAGAMPEPYYQDVPAVLEDPDTIATMLTEFNYTSMYVEGVFDCSEIAGHAEWFLENIGIETDIVMSWEPAHMVVRCNTTEGWMAFETCSEDGVVYAIRTKADYIYDLSNTWIVSDIFEASERWEGFGAVDWWTSHPELG